MKNYQVLELAEKLNKNLESLKHLRGAKFAYTILKNTNLLNEEVKTIQLLANASDGYKEYESNRINLCQTLCEKDSDGNLITKDLGNGLYEYKIDLSSKKWLDGISSLQEKYKSEIEKYSQQVSDYNIFLNKETDIEFFKMKFDDVPSDISLEIMSIIEPFIEN